MGSRKPTTIWRNKLKQLMPWGKQKNLSNFDQLAFSEDFYFLKWGFLRDLWKGGGQSAHCSGKHAHTLHGIPTPVIQMGSGLTLSDIFGPEQNYIFWVNLLLGLFGQVSSPVTAGLLLACHTTLSLVLNHQIYPRSAEIYKSTCKWHSGSLHIVFAYCKGAIQIFQADSKVSLSF